MARKYRAVIYTKTIIAEDNPRDFHTAVGEAVVEIENVGQSYGWSESIVAEDEALLPEFTEPNEEYKSFVQEGYPWKPIT